MRTFLRIIAVRKLNVIDGVVIFFGGIFCARQMWLAWGVTFLIGLILSVTAEFIAERRGLKVAP
jgi:hypothetical protein